MSDEDQAYPEDILEMFLKLLDACDAHYPYNEADYQPRNLWDRLAAEGNTELIAILQRLERHEPGFEWLVVLPKGFSEDDHTHNAVLHWARDNGIRLINNHIESTRLERSLHPQPRDWSWLRHAVREQEALS